MAGRPDRSWRHKWLDRAALLDAAEQATSPALPYFVADGRVTETSRGNLFWRGEDGVWCTPPLDEQVLPGVTRREVIDLLDRSGTPVQIRRGLVDDLHRAGGVFWTSSLSGAVAVTAIDDHPVPETAEFLADLNRRLGIDPTLTGLERGVRARWPRAGTRSSRSGSRGHSTCPHPTPGHGWW